MPVVTICVPAYRSGTLLARTLRSLLSQTVTDLVVDVGLEPDDAEATLAMCRPLLADPRVRVTINETALGFGGNVRSLFARVQTPFFLFCGHDDMLHPRHVEALLAAIGDDDRNSVAYTDSWLIGERVGRDRLLLPEGDLDERLLAFLIPGRMAACWRGLARRRVLTRPFPDNAFGGFATEFEWSLHLLCEGIAVRVTQPLIVKHVRPASSGSVSAGWKYERGDAWLHDALDHHRTAMLDGLPTERLDESMRRPVAIAAELAVMNRRLDYSHGRFALTTGQEQLLDTLDAEIGSIPGRAGERLCRGASLVRGRHEMARGNLERADALLRTIPDDDASLAYARVLRAWILHARGRLHDALELAVELDAVEPLSSDVMGLMAALGARMAAVAPDQAAPRAGSGDDDRVAASVAD